MGVQRFAGPDDKWYRTDPDCGHAVLAFDAKMNRLPNSRIPDSLYCLFCHSDDYTWDPRHPYWRQSVVVGTVPVDCWVKREWFESIPEPPTKGAPR